MNTHYHENLKKYMTCDDKNIKKLSLSPLFGAFVQKAEKCPN
jgi:hypothetical protein